MVNGNARGLYKLKNCSIERHKMDPITLQLVVGLPIVMLFLWIIYKVLMFTLWLTDELKEIIDDDVGPWWFRAGVWLAWVPLAIFSATVLALAMYATATVIRDNAKRFWRG